MRSMPSRRAVHCLRARRSRSPRPPLKVGGARHSPTQALIGRLRRPRPSAPPPIEIAAGRALEVPDPDAPSAPAGKGWTVDPWHPHAARAGALPPAEDARLPRPDALALRLILWGALGLAVLVKGPIAPAIVALFLYALLPILRATVTALLTVDPLLVRVAVGMGLKRRQRVRYLLLPLAMPHVLAGVRTAAVISIGTATLAAFIGAGGLGQPIVTGLALNDPNLILQGAVPASLLALTTEFAFELLERRLVPAHLRADPLG